jgi:NAD(P)H-dependent FMN reductase
VEADALIAVTPIFNASYSGLFKSFFDVLEPDSLAGKELADLMSGGKPSKAPADRFDDPIPFEQLLRGKAG